jgi:hypothetical protein
LGLVSEKARLNCITLTSPGVFLRPSLAFLTILRRVRLPNRHAATRSTVSLSSSRSTASLAKRCALLGKPDVVSRRQSRGIEACSVQDVAETQSFKVPGSRSDSEESSRAGSLEQIEKQLRTFTGGQTRRDGGCTARNWRGRSVATTFLTVSFHLRSHLQSPDLPIAFHYGQKVLGEDLLQIVRFELGRPGHMFGDLIHSFKIELKGDSIRKTKN